MKSKNQIKKKKEQVSLEVNPQVNFYLIKKKFKLKGKISNRFTNSFDKSGEFNEDNTHKSIHLNPGESFEAYYIARNPSFD